MCKRLSNDTIVLNRYTNPGGHQYPQPAGIEQGGVLAPGQQTYSDGVVTCQFNLSGFTTETLDQLKTLRPLSQLGNYYPIFALGSLDEDSK